MLRSISLAIILLLASVAMASPIDKRVYTRKATWSDQGLGACGITTTNGELVVGVDAAYFDSYPGYKGGNPNKNPLCGRTITATYNGASVTAEGDRSESGYGQI